MSASNFKTPRTLITEYLEASRTQAVVPTRARERLIKTPSVGTRSPSGAVRSPGAVTRSPGRSVQHDRVSSLRRKRTQSLSSLVDENTPRTLIEGYLAGEDSVAPAVRRLRRTSQTVYSASQPVGSPAKRRTLVQSTESDLDSETPRTLIQKYLRNELKHELEIAMVNEPSVFAPLKFYCTEDLLSQSSTGSAFSAFNNQHLLIQPITTLDKTTNMIETPVVADHQQSPEISPDIPPVAGSGQYDTPSPFKSSSLSSNPNITESARRLDQRKNKGKFHLTVEQSAGQTSNWESTSPSDIEPASPPNTSYHVPSSFRSSSGSELDIFMSPGQRQTQDRSCRRTKGNFNIQVPPEVLAERSLSATGQKETSHQDGKDSYSEESEEEIIPETQSERGITHQEQHIIYDLPMKPLEDQSLEDDEYVDSYRNFERYRQSGGRSRLSSIEVGRRASDFDHSRRMSNESSINRISFDKSHESGVYDEYDTRPDARSMTSPRERYQTEDIEEEISERRVNEEIVLKQRSREDSRNVAENRNFEEEFIEIYDRHRARHGRWSEGHELKENIPRDKRSARYSDGQLVQGEGQRSPGQILHLKYLGNEPVHPLLLRKSPASSVDNRSESSVDLVPSSRRSRSPRDPSFEQLFSYQNEFLSHGPRQQLASEDVNVTNQNIRELSRAAESRRSNKHYDDHEHYEGRGQPGDSHHDNHFDTDIDVNEDRISPSGPAYMHTLPDNTASFSPRVASTQRLTSILHQSPAANHHSQGQTINKSIGHFSPRMSSAQKGQNIDNIGTTIEARDHQSRIQSVPDITSFSPRISSTQKMYATIGNIESEGSLDNMTPPGGVSPRRESLTSSVTPGSGSGRRQRNRYSGNTEASSPLDTVTPSPVVSPASTPGSSAKGTRQTRQSGSGTQRLRSRTVTPVWSGKRTSSQRSSVQKTGSARMDTPSRSGQRKQIPGSSSKRRRTSGTNSSLREKNSISQFSPRMSSTQNQESVTDGSTTVMARKLQDRIQGIPDNTASFSPKMSSTQKTHTTAGSMEVDIPLETATPSLVVSPQRGSISSSKARDSRSRREQQKVASHCPEEMEVAGAGELASDVRDITVAQKKTSKPRRKQSVAQYSLPVSAVKKPFTHFAGMRVSKEAVEEVMKVSEIFWDNLAASLEAYAKHAHRKTVNMSDFVLLFKRQGLVNEKQSMNSLIEKYLPMEEREKLIPVARAFNRIEPKI